MANRLLKKAAAELVERDLLELVTSQVPEGQTLDYKKDFPKELGPTICAFANTRGGIVVVGVECTNPQDGRLPVKLVGVEATDLDTMVLRLENQFSSCLEPGLSGLTVHSVPLSGGSCAFLVDVPMSWAKPHRVKGSRHFYLRRNTQNVPLDVAAIRQEFATSERFRAEFEDFVLRRIAEVNGERLGQSTSPGGRFVVHVVPAGAFDYLSPRLSTDQVKACCSAIRLREPTSTGRVTMEGYARFNLGSGDAVVRAINFYRTGILELVDSVYFSPDPYAEKRTAPTSLIRDDLVAFFEQYFALIDRNGLFDPPFYVHGAVLGASKYLPALPTSWAPTITYRIGREELMLPVVVVEDPTGGGERVAYELLDPLWNAWGIAEAPRV